MHTKKHIRTKLLKTSDLQKNLKETARGKMKTLHTEGTQTRITADFSPGTMQSKTKS